MTVGIIGAGCVGATLAARISQSGIKDVNLIARGKYASRLSSFGICVNGERFMLPVISEASIKHIDLAVVCVKNFDLEQACKDMLGIVDNTTIILPLLNSVSPTPTLQRNFPNNRVLYGYISKIDTWRDGDQYVYNVPGDIHFGYAANNPPAEELLPIKELFANAGFGAFIDADMVRGVWRKWMLNVGANQVSALTEANYLQFAQIPEIVQILKLAMMELLNIASYEGVDLGTKDIRDLIKYLTTYKYPKKTSMLQDVLLRRRTEIDYISGDIVRLSRKWNVPCPVNLAMYYLIKSKERAYLGTAESEN